MRAQSSVLKWLVRVAVPTTKVDWDALYREQLPKIYNFFRYRVGEGPIAEDLTAMTFEKAWRARHRYRSDQAAFSTWLFTIARNVATDHFRHHREFVSLEEAAENSDPRTPEDAVLRNLDFERLTGLLAKMPDRERELLSLKYAADLNNRTIASITGLSESNVGTILYRTIQSLRAQWEEGGPNHG
jgi:RNA polymerase sigma-70 factor (ECF subfamily)